MIPVTRPYLPDRKRLSRYIDDIYSSAWLTNDGPLVRELTARLEQYLGVENLLLVANGTLALQVAYRALGLSGGMSAVSAITTPFSFIATTSSMKWEGIDPVFVDIRSDDWCLDASRVERALRSNTKALIPVHVYGNACDVATLEEIAARYGLRLIYDGAHAFGVKYRGDSLLGHGDAATLSFHATKLFHTIEGGGIVFRCKQHLDHARRMINFGMLSPDDIMGPGLNAKMNEFQAAMGLCILDDIDAILARRADICRSYRSGLEGMFEFQVNSQGSTPNYAYFPVLCQDERELLDLSSFLAQHGVQTRRYFYPSLAELDHFTGHGPLENAASVARRVLCLPLFTDMDEGDVKWVIELIYRWVG